MWSDAQLHWYNEVAIVRIFRLMMNIKGQRLGFTVWKAT